MPTIIDLSQPIRDGMVTYPGLPAPVITDHLSKEESREQYAPGHEFQIGRIDMVANTGTYLDTPFHRYGDPSHPGLTPEATGALVASGPTMVGIDSVNIDRTVDGERPAHSGLLAAGILIVEHLTGLDRLDGSDFTFTAAPPAIEGMGSFPVRAYATLG